MSGPRPRRSSLTALALYSLLASNRGSLFTIYFALFLVTEKHAPLTFALATLSVAYIGASLLSPLIGRWSDRLRRRRPFLIAGEALSLPLLISIPFLPGFEGPSLAFIVGEWVLSFGSPAMNAYVVDSTRRGERGRWYGVLGAASALGAAIGFPVAGYLIGIWGFAALFIVAGTVMALALLTVVFLLSEAEVPVAPSRRAIREMKPLATFSFAVSIRAIGWGAVVSFYGAFAYVLGASAFDIGLIAMSGWVVGALISARAGRLVDQMGEIRAMMLGASVSLGAILIFLFTTGWPELFPAQITYRVGFAFMNPAMLSWVGGMAPSGRRGEYLGFFSMVNSTLWSSGPLVGAIALSIGGSTGLFLMATLATAFSVAAIPILYRSKIFRKGTGPDPVPS